MTFEHALAGNEAATRLVSQHYKNQRVAEAAGRRRDFKSTTDQLGRKLEQILETLISHNP